MGCIFRSWHLSVGRRRGFNFLAAVYLLLSSFFSLVICCIFFFPIHMSFAQKVELALFLWLWGCIDVPCINIPIYCPSLSYSHLFSVVTISQIIYCPSNFPFSICVFLPFRESSEWRENYHNYSYNWAVFVASAASVDPFFHQPKWFHYMGFSYSLTQGSAKGLARGWDAGWTERIIKVTVGIIIPAMERATAFILPQHKCNVHGLELCYKWSFHLPLIQRREGESKTCINMTIFHH